MKLVFPRGDPRVSRLQELQLEAEASDDFGLLKYGVGFGVAGQEPQFIELGQSAPARAKRQFDYLIPLEKLGVAANQAVTYFAWADDYGPDAQARRTFSDIFFAEVRPFEEVFRPDQSGSAESGNQNGSQGGGDERVRLAELQKQIVIATWNLQRERRARLAPYSHEETLWRFHRPALWCALSLPAQERLRLTPTAPAGRAGLPATNATGDYVSDVGVVLDAQDQALEQARQVLDGGGDARDRAALETAIKEMERSRAALEQAKKSPEKLPTALAAEQAAYQALLRATPREYRMTRSRNRGQSGNSSGRPSQQRTRPTRIGRGREPLRNRAPGRRPRPRSSSASRRKRWIA